jgi:hypothetical protein
MAKRNQRKTERFMGQDKGPSDTPPSDYFLLLKIPLHSKMVPQYGDNPSIYKLVEGTIHIQGRKEGRNEKRKGRKQGGKEGGKEENRIV